MSGCKKLGVSGCKVVLEEDGAEIDDDEILQEYCDQTLVILQHDEQWPSAFGATSKTAEQEQTVAGKTLHY